jgi:cell division protein ZapA
MSETKDASVEILGRVYQIKCPATEETSLQRAAQYLEEKMRHTREAGALSMDRIAIVTALNVVHQLLTLEQQKNHHFQLINQRLHQLQNKVEQALAYHEQLEFQPAD